MRAPGATVALFTALSLCACAQRVYSVGAKNPGRPDLTAGASFSVERDPGSAATEFDELLRRKLTLALEDRGHRVSDPQDADYSLYYAFRSEGMVASMRLELLQGAAVGMETVRRGGPFVQSLQLIVVDGAAKPRPSGSRSLVWEGGAVITGPTESRKFQDLLVLAAVKQLGRTTQDTVVSRMRLHDSRAKRLRR